MNTAIATVVKQSAFAAQNMNMADLFAKRLQDLFTQNLGQITVTEFGTEECIFAGISEKISFKLPNGQTVFCRINTPKEG